QTFNKFPIHAVFSSNSHFFTIITLPQPQKVAKVTSTLIPYNFQRSQNENSHLSPSPPPPRPNPHTRNYQCLQLGRLFPAHLHLRPNLSLLPQHALSRLVRPSKQTRPRHWLCLGRPQRPAHALEAPR